MRLRTMRPGMRWGAGGAARRLPSATANQPGSNQPGSNRLPGWVSGTKIARKQPFQTTRQSADRGFNKLNPRLKTLLTPGEKGRKSVV